MPKTYRHELFIPLPAEPIFAAMTDIANWPAWDVDLVATVAPAEPLRAGSKFSITPKGAGVVKMEIESIQAPSVFIDRARLPLGVIRGTHELHAADGGTMLAHSVETRGLLGFFWDRVITRKIGAGLAEQAAALARYATGISSASKSGPP